VRRLALYVLVALVAGCGGESKTIGHRPPPERGPMTKERYIARADAICERFSRRLDSLEAALGRLSRLDPGAIPRASKLLRGADRVARQGLTELAALPRPPEHSAIDGLLAVLSEQVALLARAARAFDAGELEVAGALGDDVHRLDRRGQVLARRYGFRHCGRRAG
jgi:hypothetical protein